MRRRVQSHNQQSRAMARKEKLKKPVKHVSGEPEKPAKRRSKPGKKALREIGKQQRSTTTLLKRTPMSRLIRDIAADPRTRFFPSEDPVRFSPEAIDALCIAGEAKLLHFMRSINWISCQRGGKTITLRDVKTHKQLNMIKPV